MNIAVISMIRDPWGGSEELWYDMANTALRRQHQLCHLSYYTEGRHPKMQELISKGVKEYKRPGLRSNSRFAVIQLIDKLIYFGKKITNRSLEKIFNARPGVVIYNGTCFSVGREKKLMRLLKAHPGVRFFILAHLGTEEAPQMQPAEKSRILAAYQRAEKVFFVSDRSVRTTQAQLGIKIKNAMIVRNPVNLVNTRYVPYPAQAIPQLAVVGNLLSIHKGQDLLLRVLAQPQWQAKDWHLNIYGSGPDEGRLRTQVQKANLEQRVCFHGRVSDIRAVWEQNHILLMPSLMEGMPLALVEAMLCGRPSVVTDVGGNAEWVTDGEEGFIAPRAADDIFEEALHRAFECRGHWEVMGKKARQKALQLYDEHAGETLLKLVL